MPRENAARIDELASLIRKYKDAYYNGQPLVSDAAYTITVERDRGAGIRVGGWLLGSGAVLGASIAGDWSSLAGTLQDFARCACPLAPAACCFALIERFLRLRRKRPCAAASCVSAAAMAALGFKYAAWIGVGP